MRGRCRRWNIDGCGSPQPRAPDPLVVAGSARPRSPWDGDPAEPASKTAGQARTRPGRHLLVVRLLRKEADVVEPDPTRRSPPGVLGVASRKARLPLEVLREGAPAKRSTGPAGDAHAFPSLRAGRGTGQRIGRHPGSAAVAAVDMGVAYSWPSSPPCQRLSAIFQRIGVQSAPPTRDEPAPVASLLQRHLVLAGHDRWILLQPEPPLRAAEFRPAIVASSCCSRADPRRLVRSTWVRGGRLRRRRRPRHFSWCPIRGVTSSVTARMDLRVRGHRRRAAGCSAWLHGRVVPRRHVRQRGASVRPVGRLTSSSRRCCRRWSTFTTGAYAMWRRAVACSDPERVPRRRSRVQPHHDHRPM